MSPVAKHTFADWVTGSLHHIVTGIFFSSLANHRMICVQMRHECWARQGSLMQPMTDCLPQLNSYRCHTQNCMPGCECILAVTASWLICVWILFMWYQNRNTTCIVVFRDEETFETAAAMLSRESRTNCLTWDVMWCYPIRHILK